MKKTVLIIDDSKTQLETLKIILKRSEYNVVTAYNPQEGFCKIFEIAPDLIISDIVMPDLNGYQFCKLVKSMCYSKEIPVILLTVLDQKIDKFWSSKSGANRFVPKTLPSDELIKICNDVINENPVCEKTKEQILSKKININDVQNILNQILDSTLVRSTIMNEFRLLSENMNNEHELLANIYKIISSIIDYDIAVVWFKENDNECKNFYFDTHLNLSSDFKKNLITDILSQSHCEDDLQNFKITYNNSLFINRNVEFDDYKSFASKKIIPIYFEDNLLGCFAIFNNSYQNYENNDIFDVIVSELRLLFRIKKLYSQTKHLAITDFLTQIYNRRQFDVTIEHEFARATRYLTPLTLCLIDIDHFKNVNDTYGHKIGDDVLFTIASLIKKLFRKSDYVFRYGGEEFMIIMPATNVNNAYIPIERLRKEIEKLEFNGNNAKFNITASFGLADNCVDAMTFEQLIKNTDIALYKAKNSGRNKVVIYEGK